MTGQRQVGCYPMVRKRGDKNVLVTMWLQEVVMKKILVTTWKGKGC